MYNYAHYTYVLGYTFVTNILSSARVVNSQKYTYMYMYVSVYVCMCIVPDIFNIVHIHNHSYSLVYYIIR